MATVTARRLGSMIDAGLADAVLGAGAVALLVLATTTDVRGIAASVAVVACAVAVRGTWTRPRATSHGASVVARILLLAVVLVSAGTSVSQAATAMLGLALVLEPARMVLAGREFAVAANVREAPRTTAIQPAILVPLATGFALVVLLLAPASEPAALLVAGSALIATVTGTAESLWRIRARRRFHGSLRSLLTLHQPQFVFHWDAPSGTTFQAAMWLPHLEDLGRPFVMVLRNPETLREVAGLTRAPVVVCPAMVQMDSIVVPSVRAAFYVNNATSNAHLIRFGGIRHIQLNHGDSDKLASVSKAFRMYDAVLVAGQAAVDRFAAHGVPMLPGALRAVGRPQVAAITPARCAIGAVERPTVLYSPTWAGFHDDSSYSSLNHGVEIVSALLARDVRVVFRPHPYTRRNAALARASAEVAGLLATHARTTGVPHAVDPGARSFAEAANEADAMVSDVSSVVTDFLFSEKPFAIIAPGDDRDEFVRRHPVAAAAYVVTTARGRLAGLDTAIEAMLTDDPIREDRRAARCYHLGETPAPTYAEHFRAEVLQIL